MGDTEQGVIEDDCHDCLVCNGARRQASIGQYVWSVCSEGHTVRSSAAFRDGIPDEYRTANRKCLNEDGTHKRPYRRRGQAVKVLRTMQTAQGGRGEKWAVYRCGVCGQYHIGHV